MIKREVDKLVRVNVKVYSSEDIVITNRGCKVPTLPPGVDGRHVWPLP